MSKNRSEIELAERAFEEGNFDLLKKILPPLVERNIPAAIRISSSFFAPGISEAECDRKYVEGMFKAAELGDLKAKYQVGVFYDLGEYGISQDKKRASLIFKELAEKGNPHCMWIYACELIWGSESFQNSTEAGLKLLHDAALAGSADANMTIARFHNEGEFGFEKSAVLREKYRQLALKADDTIYDPYA
jgi:TPR repeat protein